MSRIGKKPIPIPSGVEVKWDEAKREISVKGPKGQLCRAIPHYSIEIEIQNGSIQLKRKDDEKQTKALHGLYRQLIANMVKGVVEGYEKRLELIGIGYRAEAKGKNQLQLSLGFSHNVLFVAPEEIELQTEYEKGGNPTVVVKGIDKELVGIVAAQIRAIRPPEPYKGKGIRYVGEYVRRKEGKSGKKK